MRLVLSIVIAASLAACAGGATSSLATEGGPVVQRFPGYLRVEVTPEGAVLVEGTPMTVPELEAVLDDLSDVPPVILYHRSNPSSEPPPIFEDVLDAITARRLVIQLVVEDFNDPAYTPPPLPAP